jgi:hypothetical protein
MAVNKLTVIPLTAKISCQAAVYELLVTIWSSKHKRLSLPTVRKTIFKTLQTRQDTKIKKEPFYLKGPKTVKTHKLWNITLLLHLADGNTILVAPKKSSLLREHSMRWLPARTKNSRLEFRTSFKTCVNVLKAVKALTKQMTAAIGSNRSFSSINTTSRHSKMPI